MIGGILLTYRNISREMKLARLKSDFVANVSHELRTPLALIRLYAETLELGRLNAKEKYQEYFRIIREESERLTALINNILDFSRIEAGRKEYDFKETNLAELVHSTLDSYRFQIEQNGFAFEENISPDIPPGERGPRSHRPIAAESGEQRAEVFEGQEIRGGQPVPVEWQRQSGSRETMGSVFRPTNKRKYSKSFTGAEIPWCTTSRVPDWACRWCGTLRGRMAAKCWSRARPNRAANSRSRCRWIRLQQTGAAIA